MSHLQRVGLWAIAAVVVAAKLVRYRRQKPQPSSVAIPNAKEQRRPSTAFRGGLPLGLVVVGLLLGIAALIVGRPLLTTTTAPLVSTPGVQVLGPAAGDGELGLVVRLAVRTTGCSGAAEATIVVAGTQQYWTRTKRNAGSRHRFAVVIGAPAVKVRDVGLGRADGALSDDAAFFSRYLDRPIRSYVVRQNKRTTVITGTAKEWGTDGTSLVIQLLAPWLARRSYSSCWLTLPPLTGPLSQQAGAAGGVDPGGGGRGLSVALKPKERAALGSDEPLLATTYVQPLGGAVDVGSSSPSPGSNSRTWNYACRGRQPLTTARILETARGEGSIKERAARLPGLLTADGFSEGTYLERHYSKSDCAATAVINDASRGSRRDLLVLLLGALLGLAATLIVEGGLVALRLRSN